MTYKSNRLLRILCTMYKCQPKTKSRPLVWIFWERNSAMFINSLNQLQWDELFIDNQDCYNMFSSKIKSLYNKCFSLKKLSRARQNEKPLVTTGLKISIKYRNRLYKKSVLHLSDHIKARYLVYKNVLKKYISNAEVDYYRHLFEESNNNDQRFSDSQAIVDTINDHFCTICEKLSSKLPSYGTHYKNFLKNRIQDYFYLAPVWEPEILSEIKRLNLKKALGEYGIGAKLIKYLILFHMLWYYFLLRYWKGGISRYYENSQGCRDL